MVCIHELAGSVERVTLYLPPIEGASGGWTEDCVTVSVMCYRQTSLIIITAQSNRHGGISDKAPVLPDHRSFKDFRMPPEWEGKASLLLSVIVTLGICEMFAEKGIRSVAL